MGLRVRPIGEEGLPTDGHESVKCWKCRTRIEVTRTAARATCPECGSQVAVHRLRMPMMPCRERKTEREGEVIRLQEEVTTEPRAHETIPGSRRGNSSRRMPMLENGETPSILKTEVRTRGSSPVGQRFESQYKLRESRKELFEDAEPRRAGLDDTPEMYPLLSKLLMVSMVIFVGLLILAMVLTLRSG